MNIVNNPVYVLLLNSELAGLLFRWVFGKPCVSQCRPYSHTFFSSSFEAAFPIELQMMKTANLRYCDHASEFNRMHRP